MKPIHKKKQCVLCYRNSMLIAILALISAFSAIIMTAINIGADSDPEGNTNTPTVQPTVSTPNIVFFPDVAPVWEPDSTDVEAIAKALYGECRGVESKAEQAAVAWCILNRVDSDRYPDTVIEVITQPYQITGYDEDYPVLDELAELAVDVLIRWHREGDGDINVGRTLPKEYCFFTGDGKHNYFTTEWRGTSYWNWSLESPYES